MFYFDKNIKDNKIKIEEESVIPKTFTKEEIEIAKYNTVIKLNDIKIPSSQSNILYDEIHLDSFYNFSYNFFVDLNYNNFSPLTLYNILINIYMAISDKEQLEILDNILGLNNDEKIIFYSNMIDNNNFANSEGEIKINNGAFYNSDNVEENKTYIEQITKTYTECYKLSYQNDFNFIIEWISKSYKEKNFMNKDSFKNKEKTYLLYFLLYIINKHGQLNMLIQILIKVHFILIIIILKKLIL